MRWMLPEQFQDDDFGEDDITFDEGEPTTPYGLLIERLVRRIERIKNIINGDEDAF